MRPCKDLSKLNASLQCSLKSKLQHPPRAYPGHLTHFPAREGGNLITSLDIMLRVIESTLQQQQQEQTGLLLNHIAVKY